MDVAGCQKFRNRKRHSIENNREQTMKVMVIVKASQASEAGEMPSQQLLTEMGNFNEELVKAGVMLAGEGLHPSSKGARVSFGGKNRTVTDGPFTETKELIAGFWIWQVKSLAEAIEWAKRCPNPHDESGELEIRQIFSAEDFGPEFTPELREQEASIRAQSIGLDAPRFEQGSHLVIVGLNEHYNPETRVKIPDQWHQFAPHIGKVPGQIGGNTTYGMCWNANAKSEFDYLAAVEVADGTSTPNGFTRLEIPARRYAVFTHNQHVSSLPTTIDAIWCKWAPDCGLKIAKAPCYERYTEEFNPQTGLGGMEIWIPLDA
jgi:AraC family transcriptional regulator